jgi:hypothetical protein
MATSGSWMAWGHEHAAYILKARHGRNGRDSRKRGATRGRRGSGRCLHTVTGIACAMRLALQAALALAPEIAQARLAFKSRDGVY